MLIWICWALKFALHCLFNLRYSTMFYQLPQNCQLSMYWCETWSLITRVFANTVLRIFQFEEGRNKKRTECRLWSFSRKFLHFPVTSFCTEITLVCMTARRNDSCSLNWIKQRSLQRCGASLLLCLIEIVLLAAQGTVLSMCVSCGLTLRTALF
jgi:hypothetical protein